MPSNTPTPKTTTTPQAVPDLVVITLTPIQEALYKAGKSIILESDATSETIDVLHQRQAHDTISDVCDRATEVSASLNALATLFGNQSSDPLYESPEVGVGLAEILTSLADKITLPRDYPN